MNCVHCGHTQPSIWLELPANNPTLPRCSQCQTGQSVVAWWPAMPAWLLVAPVIAASQWMRWEQQVERRFWRAVARHPDWLGRPEDCRRRLVFGSVGLQEKQLIWQAGLDDMIIECLKLDLRLRVPSLRANPNADLRLMDANTETLGFGISGGTGLRVPRHRYTQLEAERAQLNHRWPALFQRAFVDHVRLRPCREPIR